MAVLTLPSELSQGATTVISDLTMNVPGSGADVDIASTGAELPTVANGEFFEVRDHSFTQNNGLYQVVVFTSNSAFTADKVSGSAPVDADTQEAATILGTTADAKNIFYDTAGLGIWLLEQNGLSADGVTGQAIYSHAKDTWKDDSFIIANAPFPLVTIDADAGKFEIGTDGTNNNGFTWEDDPAFSIRTRKLIRNAGWNERNNSGVITARYFGAITLGAFEDVTGDTAYYQFGNNTTIDDTVNFDFAGPVNEAVEFFTRIGNPTGLEFISTTSLTASTGTFITDGFKVGGQITITSADQAGNNATHYISGVTANQIDVSGGTFTVDASDTNAILSVDNSNEVTLRLRVRDADVNGKTFAQANLASAGKTVLSNFVYSFPLANSTDLDISNTDATITGSSPYTGMSITYYSTPQSRSGLVGGSFNFGIIINGNDGTSQQVYEFVQYQLRQTTDIDAGGSTAIGRTMDGLMRFVGAELQIGSTDGGLTFPRNPEGGGSGVYIDNLNATSANDVIFYDNTGVARANPETIAVTLDFNSTIIDDTLSEYDLFYDRTIRTTVGDLAILGGGINKITSAASLPQNAQIAVGAYVRVGGLTPTGSTTMDGVYQIQAITAGTTWNVVRYDSATIVGTAAEEATVDQNCIDTPDAIIVQTNKGTGEVTDIDFTSPNTIASQSTDLSVFVVGSKIEISGTTSNNGFHTVSGSTVNQLSVEGTITTEASGGTVRIDEIVSGIATADYTFSYDFDGNVQGGRTVSTTTFVKAKAIGQSGSQYAESTVQSIVTGTPLTIPLVGQVERNYSG